MKVTYAKIGWFSAHMDEMTVEAFMEIIQDIHSQQITNSVNELMTLIEKEDLEAYLDMIRPFNTIFEEAKINLFRRRKQFEQQRRKNDPPPPPPPPPKRYTFPNILMPSFSGNYIEWMMFKSKFENRIANSVELDDVEKLHYLRECLADSAKDMHAPNDTFASLWQALQDRYDRKRIVVETHLDELFNTPKMKKKSARDLSSLLDLLLRNVRVLESLGLEQNDMSWQIFLHLLCSRLDNETRKAFEMEWSGTGFLDYDESISKIDAIFWRVSNKRLAQVLDHKSIPRMPPNLGFLAEALRIKPVLLWPVETTSAVPCALRITTSISARSFWICSQKIGYNKHGGRLGLCINCLTNRHATNKCMQESVFDWVVVGRGGGPSGRTATFVSTVGRQESDSEHLSDLVKRFWEIETCQPSPNLTVEEKQVEDHFLATHKRNEEGRYVVELPLKPTINDLGDSKSMAVRRFQALERRFEKDGDLQRQYAEFINEYLQLGHMSPSKINLQQKSCGSPTYFLPHHAVLRPDSTTTKLRFVFGPIEPHQIPAHR
jgi:Protein of unknown function (DUF1759)